MFRSSLLARAIRCALAGALGMALGPGAALAEDEAADTTTRPAGGASASGSQAGATLPAVTVTTSQGATGTAAEGYREDRVSNVGPWQGRDLQDTPYSITV
ncbi:MAG: hypothetical protein QM674_14650, partial [Burkholderiaceae bacterium]